MIHQQTWHIWILISLMLFVAEIFHPVFIFAAIGIAALISAAFAYFFGFEIQILAFAISALVVFFAIRPSILKYFYSSNNIKTNVQAMVGKTAIVTEDIIPNLNKGRVKIGGETWIGVSDTSKLIKKGEKVEIVKVDGAKLYVKKGEK